jgi:ArsR family transcriptional regulator
MNEEKLHIALSEEEIERYADLLKVLACPARLRILSALSDQELTVSQICEATGMKQSLVSQQLKQLRLSDVVQRRKEVPKVFYSLREKNVINVLNCLNSCGCCKAETRRNGDE